MDQTSAPTSAAPIRPELAPIPWKMLAGGLGMLVLGIGLALWAWSESGHPGAGKAALKLGFTGAMLVVNGSVLLWVAAKITRFSCRLRAGLCPECGFNLGGKFDAPCPHCHPDGDPNFISPMASEAEFRAWLAKQPRAERRRLSDSRVEVRWSDLSLQTPKPFELAPVPHEEGGITFIDAGRVPLGDFIAQIGLVVLTLVFFGGFAVMVSVASGDLWVTLGASAVALLLTGLTIWLVFEVKRRRNNARTVTLWPGAGAVHDQVVSRKGEDRLDGSLGEVFLTLSEIHIAGGPHGTLDRFGVVLWAPRGPLLLFCAKNDDRAEAYLEGLPEWLRRAERTDPAHITITWRRRGWSPPARGQVAGSPARAQPSVK